MRITEWYSLLNDAVKTLEGKDRGKESIEQVQRIIQICQSYLLMEGKPVYDVTKGVSG